MHNYRLTSYITMLVPPIVCDILKGDWDVKKEISFLAKK
jgi:hypothetical protein